MSLRRTVWSIVGMVVLASSAAEVAQAERLVARRTSGSCRRLAAPFRVLPCRRRSCGCQAPSDVASTTTAVDNALETALDRFVTLTYGEHLTPYVNAVAQLPHDVTALGTRHGLVLWNGRDYQAFTGPDFNPLADARGRRVPGNSPLPSNDVHALLIDARGKLWIGTAEGLAWYVDGEISDVTRRLPATGDKNEEVWKREGNQGWLIRGPHLRGHDVTQLFQRADGRIIIGTRNAGVIAYDPTSDQFSVLHREPDGNQWVTAAAEDRDGTLWIAVNRLGVLRVVDDRVERVAFPESWGAPENVRTLCLGVDRTLWIGTTDRLIARRRDGQAQVFTADDGLLDDFVGSLWTDRNGDVWAVGSEGASVFRSGQWLYPEINQGRPHFTMFVGRLANGDLWMATAGGVVRDPPITWQTVPSTTREIEQTKAEVAARYPNLTPNRFLAVDGDKRVWIVVRQKRLLRYDGRTWTDLANEINRPGMIYAVMADSQNRVWVGTSGKGLYRFAGEKIDEFFNLPNRATSVIYSLAEGPNGVVYAGAQFGFYKFDGDDPQTISMQHQVHDLLVDGLGRVWGTDYNDGLLLYDGAELRLLSKGSKLSGWHLGGLMLVRPDAVRVGAATYGSDGTTRQTVFECDGRTIIEIKPGDADR